ncbi:hypothetical protein ACEPAF_142 [Sanghuangporus sanghuang]
MDDKWFGPFKVMAKVGTSTYKLKIPKTWKHVHPVFNEILLKLAVQPSFESQMRPPPPSPVIVDEHEEYEWVGYEEVTWKLDSDVNTNTQEVIQEFYRKHLGAPRKLMIPRQNLQVLYKFMLLEGLCGWSGHPTLKGG